VTANRHLVDEFEFPGSDRAKRRLEQFRERLQGFPILDGLASGHE
jgi:hypothetical protein